MEIHSTESILYWTLFLVLILVLLLIDLFLVNKKNHTPSVKEAIVWSGIWITLALLFNVFVYLYWGEQKGLEFFTGYLLEKSLSVDNLFVFVVIFTTFKVPRHIQHKVLFAGIVGAIVFRIVFILAGAALLAKFHWMFYVFGIFLIITGVKLAIKKDDDETGNLTNNRLLKFTYKFLPVSKEKSEFFIVWENGKLMFTPLFITLIIVEASDIIFALDSIPAVFGVTNDPFIVFTSNIFAILGLRSLYFLIADMVNRFIYLKIGLGIILAFVGFKMLIVDIYKIHTGLSLLVIFMILTISIFTSLYKSRKVS